MHQVRLVSHQSDSFKRLPALILLALLCAAHGSAQPQPIAQGSYKLRLNQPAQKILGLGFEIQSDSIGSANLGIPNKVVAVPHNLIPSERQRFYREMLKGFRYCRLAMGLYLRGLDPEQKRIVERYPGQMKDLKEMMEAAEFEGFAPEYWSPAPYWKSNGQYLGGSLKRFDAPFLEEFADALVADMRYLQQHGLRLSMWGLQNEPPGKTLTSPTCYYTDEQYYAAMKIVAPKMKAAFPALPIHVNSWEDGQHTGGSKLVRQDAALARLIDFWTWHRIGTDSNEQIQQAARFNSDTLGKPVFNNEFEYLHGPASDERFINTAQSVMNWFVFENSPTWFWLHALKPTYNAEASGYSLGFWRPQDDDDFTRFPQIKKGHWDYNKQNWHSLKGFIKHLPWDSVRYQVEEDQVRLDNRILAWKTPAGKIGLAITNRSGAPFCFNIDLGAAKRLRGIRYTPSQADIPLAASKGKMLAATVPHHAIEFWIEQ